MQKKPSGFFLPMDGVCAESNKHMDFLKDYFIRQLDDVDTYETVKRSGGECEIWTSAQIRVEQELLRRNWTPEDCGLYWKWTKPVEMAEKPAEMAADPVETVVSDSLELVSA